jgi:hypothetical protein
MIFQLCCHASLADIVPPAAAIVSVRPLVIVATDAKLPVKAFATVAERGNVTLGVTELDVKMVPDWTSDWEGTA